MWWKPISVPIQERGPFWAALGFSILSHTYVTQCLPGQAANCLGLSWSIALYTKSCGFDLPSGCIWEAANVYFPLSILPPFPSL